MNDTKDERLSVYEISYLIVPTITEEEAISQARKIEEMTTAMGAFIITSEVPHMQDLAYTMRVKNVSGTYEKYNAAYFGWFKFELASSKITGLKESIEIMPSVIRMMVISTVKENTYLGKRASLIVSDIAENVQATGRVEETKKEISQATVEEMDKSIDAMVKEVV